MIAEEILRVISATVLTVAAGLSTFSWRRWAHPLIRPGMLYSAVVLWFLSAYRWWLAIAAIQPGSEFGEFIRLFINVAFMAVGIAFIIHALATREYARNFRLSKKSD